MASASEKYGIDESRFEKAVSRNFICSICLNVVKNPKMCTDHEHVFCSDCITEHLGNASTCPQCMDPLTVETLKRPPRLFLNFLLELKIKCDHYSRGCRQYVQLEELPSHAMNCDFAPVLCSNKDCGMEINKRDKIYHETKVCEHRHKCHECTEIRREMDEMTINMADVKREVTGLKTHMNQLKTEMTEGRATVNAHLNKMKIYLVKMNSNMTESQAKISTDLAKVSSDLSDMMVSLAGLKEELLKESRANTTGEELGVVDATTTQLSLPVEPAAIQGDIVLLGGCGSSGHGLNSVKRFSWQTRSWASLTPMKEPRSNATSFVYNNQIFVAGGISGSATDSVDVLNIHGVPMQWETFPAKLPIKVYNHKTVVYQNRLIVVGGYDEAQARRSDAIYEVLLTPPYSVKSLLKMPEARHSHGTVLIQDKVFILGGLKKSGATDIVLVYDVVRKECKQMPSLPYAVHDMSTVSWRDKVILLGGRDSTHRRLNDVLMYDTVTGETEILPPMKYKRRGSSAVVTGDRIIVMGGRDDTAVLNSVECYNFSSNLWEELPSMIKKRERMTAVVV